MRALVGEVVWMSTVIQGIRRLGYDFSRWVREERVARRAVVHPSPCFILGMQKSGTSAIAGLLSLRTGVPGAVDLAREWRRCTIIKASRSERNFNRYVRRNAADFARPLVKEPGLTYVHQHLVRRWPDSKVVIVVREPLATIRSVLERLKLPGDRDSIEDSGLRDIPQPWRVVLDNRWLGVGTGHYIDQLAERWCIAARLALAKQDTWMMVRYEDFVRDKIGTIDSIAGRFDFPVVAEIDSFLDRPFQPRGARRDPREVFGPNLERIVERTESLVDQLGYPA